MKVVAHPVVVAAALGLLGPEALAGFMETEEETPCAGCTEEESNELASLGLMDDTLFTVDAPSAEDFARVELEWKALQR